MLDGVATSGGALFVAGSTSGSLYRISLNSGEHQRDGTQVKEWQSDGGLHDIAFDERRGTAFATRSGTNVVDAFSPTTLKLLARIPAPEDPDSILYDPAHDLIYAASGNAKKATLIDPKKLVLIGEIELGGTPEDAAFDPVSQLVYQNLISENAILAIDLATRRIVGRWSIAPCSGPTGLVIDGKNRRAFIGCLKNSLVVVFDLSRHVVVASLPVGGGPDSVDYDPTLARIYSTGLAGRVTVIQQLGPNSYRLMDSVATHLMAHSLTVDPDTHQVYVGYASLAAAPRVAIFTALP
jgi:DNA-binding beta-propeller fold protein YncE